MLWIIFAAMTVAALALILIPLWRQGEPAADRAAYDVEVYRDQLEELDRDLRRGLIDDADADAARTEIGRRLLATEAAQRSDEDSPSSRSARRRWIAGCLAVAIPALAAVIYAPLGAPGLPGLPAAERQAAPTDDSAAQRAVLIAKLGERVQQNPDDATGWSHLGTLLMSDRQYDKAAEALRRASELMPDSAGMMSRYGEALTFRAGGTVGEQARAAFDAALSIDAREPRARFYLGVADHQAGRPREALKRWRALEAETPADAPWRAPLRAQIARLAAELGETPRAEGDGQPGPTSEDVDAASRLSADDRQTMIRGMVARLAERLAETPDDADGWLRLGRSYKVLGEAEKSRDAFAKAAALRPDDVAVLSAYAASMANIEGGNAARNPRFNEVNSKILRLDPNHRTALWFTGLSARLSGDQAAAARHWQKLLSLLEAGSREHAELTRRLGELEASR